MAQESKFNNKIMEHLYKRDMMQKTLAEEVGLSKQAIGAIVTGVANPTLETAMKIAKVFGVTAEEVFQLKDEVK